MSRWRRVLASPLMRIVLWFVGSFLLAILLRWSLVPLLNWLGVPEAGKPSESLAAFLALLLMVRFVEGRTPWEAGLGMAGVLRDTALGFLLGAGLMAGIIGIMALAGFYRIDGTGLGDPALWGMLGVGLWHYLWVGVMEEVAFRGVVLRILEDWLGSWWALGLSALLFGLLHLSNANSSLFAALAIAVEAGILLGAAYMLTRNLWLAIGIHWAWNFFEGPVFGTAISGGMGGVRLFHPIIQGPDLWTGGEFGPEASLMALLIATAAGVALTVLAVGKGRLLVPAWQRPKRRVW